jgi:hypothetical protein
MMKYIRLLTFFAVIVTASARADDPVKPANRADATAIVADARKILTPNGVERLEISTDRWDRSVGLDSRH